MFLCQRNVCTTTTLYLSVLPPHPSFPLHLRFHLRLLSFSMVSCSGHGTTGQRSASAGHTDPLLGNSNERSLCVHMCARGCVRVHVCLLLTCLCAPVRVLIIKNKHFPRVQPRLRRQANKVLHANVSTCVYTLTTSGKTVDL